MTTPATPDRRTPNITHLPARRRELDAAEVRQMQPFIDKIDELGDAAFDLTLRAVLDAATRRHRTSLVADVLHEAALERTPGQALGDLAETLNALHDLGGIV